MGGWDQLSPLAWLRVLPLGRGVTCLPDWGLGAVTWSWGLGCIRTKGSSTETSLGRERGSMKG